jgi:hypothetical protein
MGRKKKKKVEDKRHFSTIFNENVQKSLKEAADEISKMSHDEVISGSYNVQARRAQVLRERLRQSVLRRMGGR